MATKKTVWQEKTSATTYDTIYPRTVAEQVVLNNDINNNLGIDVDSRLDKALEAISDTDKRIRAQGTSTGNALALELSVPTFTLLDGTMVRLKLHVNTSAGATLNVNNTGAKPIIRIDGEPIDLELKQGTWCIFIYSATLDSWVFEGWSTKAVTKTAIFTESGTWTVPANVTSVDVFLMGGGGGGGGGVDYDPPSGTGWSHDAAGGGGGAGRIKKQTLSVTAGTVVNITVGTGGAGGSGDSGSSGSLSGTNGGNGGTTSFGSTLSATGGNGGTAATASSYYTQDGGNGGSGSAGGGGGWAHSGTGGNGGDGDYCGGGGAGCSFVGINATAGNGGTYGGGGGSLSGTVGNGGTYGGKGGSANQEIAPVAGTNTTAMTLDFIGEGKAGANGVSRSGSKNGGGGGGGGYGGNGGDGGEGSYISGEGNYYGANGGGGGYGGNGYGNASSGRGSGGGGGGYGGNATGSGGGGYGASNYGKGGNGSKSDGENGKSGICIITYQIQEA